MDIRCWTSYTISDNHLYRGWIARGTRSVAEAGCRTWGNRHPVEWRARRLPPRSIACIYGDCRERTRHKRYVAQFLPTAHSHLGRCTHIRASASDVDPDGSNHRDKHDHSARTYASPPIVVPANYRQTFTHYATVDRADGDGAVRVLYITSAAIPVFQKTGVFPDGTMVIMEIYQPHTAADGSIQHDPSGHFVPGSLHSVLVKLKVGTASTPVSTAVAPTVNQRGWVYAAFDATTGTVDGFNQPLCQSCHLRAQAWDDLFTRPELLAFAQTVEPQYLLCQLSGKQPCEEPESK